MGILPDINSLIVSVIFSIKNFRTLHIVYISKELVCGKILGIYLWTMSMVVRRRLHTFVYSDVQVHVHVHINRDGTSTVHACLIARL